MNDELITTAPRGKTVSEREESEQKTIFGFWVYLMTDCVLFASLFATYAVLHTRTYGGPTGHDIFSLHYVLVETFILLTSSFTCGLGVLAANKHNKKQVLFWFVVTFLLGLSFLGMELSEFSNLVRIGDSWRRSGFLSAYFTLVGTHGFHITVGLLWMATLLVKVFKSGLKEVNIKRLTLLSMFWHFLDIVWIFIFTVVYLMGVIKV